LVVIGLRGWLIAAAVFAAAYLIWIVFAGAISAFLLLFTGVLFAAGLMPIVNRLRKRTSFGAAVGIAFGSVIIVIAFASYLLVQPLGTELIRLVEAIPSFVQSLQERLAAAQIFLKNNAMAGQLASTLANAAGGVVAGVGQRLLGGPALVAGMIGNAVLIVLLAVGWMLSADELAQFTLSLLPAAPREDWRKALQEIGTRLTAYVAGIVINGALVGAAMGLSLALLGIPFALLLAVVVAVFQAIPMVGAIISGPIVLVIVLATSGWTKMLVVLAIFAIVQIVDQNVVSPIIFGQRVQLSFLLIIFATIVGGTLLGIGGAFLAVPAAAVLQVIVVRIGAPAIRRAGAIAVTESAE